MSLAGNRMPAAVQPSRLPNTHPRRTLQRPIAASGNTGSPGSAAITARLLARGWATKVRPTG